MPVSDQEARRQLLSDMTAVAEDLEVRRAVKAMIGLREMREALASMAGPVSRIREASGQVRPQPPFTDLDHAVPIRSAMHWKPLDDEKTRSHP